MKVSKSDIAVIQLTKATREKLRLLGRKSETYNDIINRLMEGSVESLIG